MKGFNAFPIYDFRSGLTLDREPWMLPTDAFQVAEDVYFSNGRLIKRKGYVQLGTGVEVTEQCAASDDDGYYYEESTAYSRNDPGILFGKEDVGSNTWQTLDAFVRFPVVPIPNNATVLSAKLQVYVVVSGNNVEATCYGLNNAATFSSDPSARNTTTASVDFSQNQWTSLAANDWRDSPDVTEIVQELVGAAGWNFGDPMAFKIADDRNAGIAGSNAVQFRAYDWAGNNTFGAKLVVSYKELDSEVMGAYEFFTVSGSSTLCALTEDYLYQYDSNNSLWVGKGGFETATPDFTGNNADYFWYEIIPDNLLGASTDLLLLVNNKDAPKTWDGNNLSALSGNNYPSTAKLVVMHKNRLIYLNTLEGGTRYPQRARCTDVGTYNNCSQNIYVDADTSEWITGIAFIRNELLVWFEKSVWWLRYTGNATVPFAWERIGSGEGCLATWTVDDFNGKSYGLGETSLVYTDGLQTNKLDEQIPEFIKGVDPDNADRAYSLLAEELRQYLLSYPGAGASVNNKTLVYNFEDNAFSEYGFGAHVFGFYKIVDARTWDGNNSLTWDTADFSWDDTGGVAGYPTNIFGKNSLIYELFNVASDAGNNISARAKTKRLVPYEDAIAKLGWVDIIGDAGSEISFQVRIYKDYNPDAFQTHTITMNAAKAGDTKARKRIRVMENGERFTLEFYDSGSIDNTWAIDAIIPWFKKVGPSNG